jgi:hypothetical protein
MSAPVDAAAAAVANREDATVWGAVEQQLLSDLELSQQVPGDSEKQLGLLRATCQGFVPGTDFEGIDGQSGKAARPVMCLQACGAHCHMPIISSCTRPKKA